MEVEEAKLKSLSQHDLGFHRAGGWLGSKRLGAVQDRQGGLWEKKDRSRVSEGLSPADFHRHHHLHGFVGAGTEEMDNWSDWRNATGQVVAVKGQGTKGLKELQSGQLEILPKGKRSRGMERLTSHRMWMGQGWRESGFPGDGFQVTHSNGNECQTPISGVDKTQPSCTHDPTHPGSSWASYPCCVLLPYSLNLVHYLVCITTYTS